MADFENIAGAAGIFTSALGMFNSTFSSYFATKSAALKLKAQGESLKFQSQMTAINSEMIEAQAWQAWREGQRRTSFNAMKAGQVKSTARAMYGASGAVVGHGSSAEALASTELIKDVEMLTSNASTVFQVENLRMTKVGLQGTSALQNIKGNSLINSGNNASPYTNAFGSFVSGAGNLANTYYSAKKYGFLSGKGEKK